MITWYLQVWSFQRQMFSSGTELDLSCSKFKPRASPSFWKSGSPETGAPPWDIWQDFGEVRFPKPGEVRVPPALEVSQQCQHRGQPLPWACGHTNFGTKIFLVTCCHNTQAVPVVPVPCGRRLVLLPCSKPTSVVPVGFHLLDLWCWNNLSSSVPPSTSPAQHQGSSIQS